MEDNSLSYLIRVVDAWTKDDNETTKRSSDMHSNGKVGASHSCRMDSLPYCSFTFSPYSSVSVFSIFQVTLSRQFISGNVIRGVKASSLQFRRNGMGTCPLSRCVPLQHSKVRHLIACIQATLSSGPSSFPLRQYISLSHLLYRTQTTHYPTHQLNRASLYNKCH